MAAAKPLFMDALMKGQWFDKWTKREFLFAFEMALTSERHKEMLMVRLTGNNGKGLTYEEVGRRFGTSAARAGQICELSLRRIRGFLRGVPYKKHGVEP